LLDYIISPVTSVGSYLSNPADVNKIFGISSDIDVYAVDPDSFESTMQNMPGSIRLATN
jgi:hypothetical protein